MVCPVVAAASAVGAPRADTPELVRHGLRIDAEGGLDLPLQAVGGSVVAGPSGSLAHGQGVYLSVHDQPVRTGLELSSQCCPRIRLASKPLVARMPERFLPLLTCRVDLPRQCRARALLTLRRGTTSQR